jgi:hypothetical protein
MLALICCFIIGQSSDPVPDSGGLAFQLDTLYFRYRITADSAEHDSAVFVFEPRSAGPELPAGETGAGLRLSGVKDFFFDTNEGFDQGLSIAVNGEIEGVKVEGNLSDQATPSQTMQIGDIEKMSLRAATANFSAGLGDLTLPLPFGIQDEIQGGRIGMTARDSKNCVNAAYALNRGSFRRMEFSGSEGKQGPYLLTGRAVAGTERVYVTQGFGIPALLKRDADYLIDYEQAIITFTSRFIITNRSRITVEYTEATSTYPRIFSELDTRTAGNDFSVTAMVRRSVDDRTDPIGFALSPVEIESLRAAGDSMTYAHVYCDTSSQGSYNLENGHFVFMGEGSGQYVVTFFYTGENQGDYAYDPVSNGFVYTGAGLGNYSPTRFTPLPQDQQFYGVSMTCFNALTTTLYGSKFDQNTFSPQDDADNGAKGFEVNVQRHMKYLSLDGAYLRYDNDLALPRSREYIGFNNEWNTSDTLQELAQLSLGIQPVPVLGADLAYGVLNQNHYRKSIMIKPWFSYFGYSTVDTLSRYLAGMAAAWRSYSVSSRYEYTGSAQYAQYALQYALGGQSRVGFSGEYDRDELERGITSRLDFASVPVSVSVGHRNCNDTTFLFGASTLSLLYSGFRLVGTVQQTQSYSQKKDEAFFRVDDGTGSHVYDSTTQSYIPKQGGNYIKRIVLLRDYQRVTTRNAGFEMGYARGSYDGMCRFDYARETDFYSHAVEAQVSLSGDPAEIVLAASQDFSNDSRYALAANILTRRSYRIDPSYRRAHAHAEKEERIEKEGDFLKERRTDYRGDVSVEFFQKPILRPLAGYTHSYLYSQFFESLDLALRAPRLMLTVIYPFKTTGRAEVAGELVQRMYDRADVPYFFTAAEPPGLSKNFSVTVGIGVGSNTVLNLTYWIRFPSGDDYFQTLNFQTRIKF